MKFKQLPKLTAVLLASSFMLIPEIAAADTLGVIANRVVTSIQGVTSLAGAIGYMVGFFFILGAVFKFKQHGDNPEQYPIRTPIFLVLAALMAIFMTSVATTGKDTVWGSGGQSQGSSGAGLANGL
ncbi:MAG: hypothetical protein CTY35_00160 [Methylotenera sp.]|uniref:hypothetical protein n=1 Tax=Methylotenera sp. TaxID=2051956 RepID=UPI000D40E0F0|nr:hypothetical protein [Methylotenera sp.]PPC84769.1 MAG: hypothetical protein CTY38_00160 [Methylotenera sp.]PPD02128.1 MAG: hypothetical protein CTY35_00160 [Methylotenera sp.]